MCNVLVLCLKMENIGLMERIGKKKQLHLTEILHNGNEIMLSSINFTSSFNKISAFHRCSNAAIHMLLWHHLYK